MNVDQALAAGYLCPSTESPWRWGPDGDVLVWSGGATIAFRAEVEAVLERLAPKGLPPFGAVVMLLAACRDGWEQGDGRAAILRHAGTFDHRRPGAEANAPGRQLMFQWVARGVQQVVKDLDRVSRLPPELRRGKEAKAVLAETVFEAAPKRLSAAEAERVMRGLSDGVNTDRLTVRFTSTDALREFADDADALRRGLPLVNEQSLALRRRTGLDALPAPAELDDLSPSERVRRLIADLRRDRELAGLARLAQDLMAAVHVPRALHAHEDLPLGGVSDLSNRGPLDRLLVSELANDELTLSVRVALNEALYLRRESPPRQPPGRRAILLDAGVRMWGVPRLFGTAVALALAATADKEAELVAYRATAGGVERVDLTTREGLVASLEALETAPHPGGALRPFFAALGPDAGPRTDAILVTHPDALADRAFGAALRSLDDPAMYAATVDRDGSFRLAAVSASGRTVVREAKLSLDKILAPPPAAHGTPPATAGESPGERPRQPGTPLMAGPADPSLPAIFYADPFPLRLPHVADPKYARSSRRHGLVAVTKDRRLLHWDSPDRAARQITAMLPGSRPRGMWVDEEAGVVRIVYGHARRPSLRLVTADLSTGKAADATLELATEGRVVPVLQGGTLYAVGETRVEAFDVATGAKAGHVGITPHSWSRDRFLYDRKDHWHALAHDGHGPRLEKVPLSVPAGRVLTLFDREGHDGPWALLKDGRVLDGAAGAEFPRRFLRVPVSWQLLGVSADGHRLAVRAFEKFVLDLEDGGEPRRFDGDPAEELLGPQLGWSTKSTPPMRPKFDSIFADARGRLSLVTGRNEVFQVDVNEAVELILKEMGRDRSQSGRTLQWFGPAEPPAGTRTDLKTTNWADGSRAFLDARGMLHLKSSDASLPELSLVLSRTKLAGWSSDGRVFGPEQYLGDARPSPAVGLWKLIEAFVVRLRT